MLLQTKYNVTMMNTFKNNIKFNVIKGKNENLAWLVNITGNRYFIGFKYSSFILKKWLMEIFIS